MVISAIFTEIMLPIQDSFYVLSLPKIGQLGPITNEEINQNLKYRLQFETILI